MKAVGSHSSRPRYEEKTPTPAGQSSFLQPYCWLFTQTFLIALFNYRIFSYKEKILGGLGRWLITTMQALAGTQVYILSVMVDNGSFPFVLMNLGNSNSL